MFVTKCEYIQVKKDVSQNSLENSFMSKENIQKATAKIYCKIHSKFQFKKTTYCLPNVLYLTVVYLQVIRGQNTITSLAKLLKNFKKITTFTLDSKEVMVSLRSHFLDTCSMLQFFLHIPLQCGASSWVSAFPFIYPSFGLSNISTSFSVTTAVYIATCCFLGGGIRSPFLFCLFPVDVTL